MKVTINMLRIAWRNFICLVFGVCFFLSNQAEEVEWKSGRVFTSELCVFNCVYLYHACSEGLTQRPSYADEILESDCFGTWEEVCAIVAIFGISGCKLFSLEKRWP